jgi:hypothetical protein
MPSLRRAVPAVVRAASQVRGERVVHPRGETYDGRLVVPGGAGLGAPLLDEPGDYAVLVRRSRSVGLPAPLPDVHGLAVRVLDCYGPGRHQDWLVDSTFGAPLLRRWPVPRFTPAVYSSLLAYDVGGTRLLLGARPVDDGFALLVATPHGPWTEVGQVKLGDVVTGGRRVRFDPWTTGGGIRPAGWVQELRQGAYPASHVAPDE